jgi:peroxiredoxin Q/BCP
MAQLRQDYHLYQEQETEILAVGPESPEAFRDYWLKNNMPFPGMPDPEHNVLKLFGQEVNLFKFGRMPAMVVLDKKGIVRFAHYGKQMSDIPDNQEVLMELQKINQEN